MKISHIICTRNRAEQLAITLGKFNTALMSAHQIELVLVDSESTDATPQVMAEFAEKYKRTRIVRAGKGLGRARNAGIDAAKGDLIAFTDDDCYLDDNYYTALRLQFAEPREHHYGMGQILLFDPDDDWRIANATISQMVTIKPRTLLPTGTFQGANIFFLREVFEKAGKFRDDMGSGTPFPCEDIEFGTRASLAGFTGVFTPLIKVFHHHGRKAGSAEADDTVLGYETGRGAYYGGLIVDGINEVWKLWLATTHTGGPPPPRVLERLEREFRGAADYIRYRLDAGDTAGQTAAPGAGQAGAEKPSPKQAQGAKA
ncbi:MAG TPA: glycosyltransferase family 2 protein [Xanthobacteraceae bacterium]|nr:glycosyltransferase family 2 protein [Xanthobacteraceae bacterium]